MATTRKYLVALVAVLMAMPLFFSASASGQAASPCPPGQPPGRPPGVPPGPPGSPPGAPEGRPPQYTSLAECQLRLSQSSASAGERVTLSGAGYGAASAVTLTLTLNSTPMSLGQATTDSSGAFSRTVTIPAAAELGSHTITAAGVDPAGVGYVLSAAFEVSAGAAAPASGTLPRTGAGTFAMVMVALLLVAAGAALVVAARRRRSTATPITP